MQSLPFPVTQLGGCDSCPGLPPPGPLFLADGSPPSLGDPAAPESQPSDGVEWLGSALYSQSLDTHKKQAEDINGPSESHAGSRGRTETWGYPRGLQWKSAMSPPAAPAALGLSDKAKRLCCVTWCLQLFSARPHACLPPFPENLSSSPSSLHHFWSL